ncbi:MAG: tyrosine-type recombinase/integrase [Terriglobales bacterium]
MRRTWTCGKVGVPKSKASYAPVPLHSLLAEFIRAWKQATPYSQPADWVFASFKCKGKQPRVANMLVEYHLRPAAVKAGVLLKDDKVRFGVHNLRHSLASFLVRTKTDPKTVQALLRIRMSKQRFNSMLTVLARIGWQLKGKCSKPSCNLAVQR